MTVAILVQSVMIAGAPSEGNKIHPELSGQMAQVMSNNSQDTIRVIVVMKEQYQLPEVKGKNRNHEEKNQNRRETIGAIKEQSKQSQQSIQAVIKGKGPGKVNEVESLWIMNAIGLEATPDVIEELARRNDVEQVIPDFEMHVLDDSEIMGDVSMLAVPAAWGVEKINAPLVWGLEYTGAGINVSILDTGIYAAHIDLDDLDDNASTNDPKVIKWKDYVNGLLAPYDDHGHGTHVAGTVAGTGAGGTQTGVAPGSHLFGVKVISAGNVGYYSDIIAGVQWSIDNGADIVSMSFGGPHDSSMTIMVNNAIAFGVVPVIAAGNNGNSSNSINCPGDEENATTVGASDSSDNIYSLSSRGPVTGINGSYTKPDVVAPGVGIISTSISGGYTSMSGTSMATPHVSGAVALILQANPGVTSLQVRQLLEDTSIDISPVGKDNTTGSGRIDVLEAIAPFPFVTHYSIEPDPTNTNATLNITFFDNRDNVSYAMFYLDNDTANFTIFTALDGSFNTSTENVTQIIDITNLLEGTHIVRIRVKDNLNYWNNKTNFSFTVDLSPPIISLSSPQNNSFIKSNTTINLTINDTYSSVTNVTYNYNGTNLTLLPPYDINTSSWPEGPTGVTVWTKDGPGNVNLSTFMFTIDDTPPNITSVQHNGTGIIDGGDTVWVNLTGNGGNQSFFTISGTNVHVSLDTITSNYYSKNNSTPQGIEVNSSNLTGYLIDKAGNINSSNASTPISIDSLFPRINLTSPANISYLKSGTIIHFTISDIFLENVTYSLNSTQANYTNITNKIFPAPYELNTTDWNESSFDLTIWANDSLNHINVSNYHIIVDNKNPNLTLTSPASDYSTTQTSVTIKGTSDADADITINGVLVTNNNGTFTQTYTLVLGYNTFTINATDKAGNVNSTVLTVIRYTLNTPSSGGGGGGGGTSGEDFNNIAETQTQRNTILKDRQVSYGFEKTLNPIIYINFTAKLSAGMVTSKIEVLRHTSTLVEIPAPGLVYKNINIWVGNYGWANDRSIVNATIIFAVPKEWITFHSVQDGGIALYRYHNDSWEPLPTSIINTNGEYVYYESVTPGFSPFAISGEPGPVPTVIRTPVPEPVNNTSVILIYQVPVEPEQNNWNAPFWAFLIIIVLSFIATIYDDLDGIHTVINNIKQRGWR
ncbi:MAG: S8 family serine peptidase [ANME-2 cluster archaeon]|nr:S8 family serine peptidase [ANME-2 cluster archaeon]